MRNLKKNLFCLIMLLFILLFYLNKNIRASTIIQEVGIASSPNPVGSGARATGMGGAFIGIADDATSASWNPAGLIQLERPEISIVGAYFNRREVFSSDISPEINNTSEVDDLNLNYFSATYPFRFYKNMVVSINYQRLYDFKRHFDYQSESSSPVGNILHFDSFRQRGYIGALGLAYAIEILPTLSLGASLNIWTDKLVWENGWEEILSFRDIIVEENGDKEIVETIYAEKYSEFNGINTNLGIQWNMNKYMTIGIIFKTPFDASIRHEYNFRQEIAVPPDKLIISDPPPLDEDVKLHMPLSYGAGLAWRMSDTLSFDLDIYRTDWSDYVLIDARGYRLSPIDGRYEGASKVKDTTQIRFGGEYLLISKKNHLVVPLRAGIFYDPEPFYDEVMKFYGASFGSGIAYKGIIFDMAYQVRWGRNVDTDSLIFTSRADITQHLLLASLIIHF